MKIPHSRRRKSIVCFLLCFLAGLWLAVTPATARNAPSPTALESAAPTANLLQAGRQQYENGRIVEAIDLWERAAIAQSDPLNRAVAYNYLATAYQDLGRWPEAATAIETSLAAIATSTETGDRVGAIRAQALNARGSWELARGRAEDALATWQAAEAAYDRAENPTGRLGSQINQAAALQALGQHLRARALLEGLARNLETQPDSQLKADGLRGLGVALQTVGELQRSKEILELSWDTSLRVDPQTDNATTLMAIGNVARDIGETDIALDYYREAALIARDPLTEVRSRLNELGLLVDLGRYETATPLADELRDRLATLPPSRYSVYARVNFSESLLQLPTVDNTTTARLLAGAIDDARNIEDDRAQAYALTELGKLYQHHQQWDEARTASQQALQIAQSHNADDIVARAAAQLGAIEEADGQSPRAIAAYNLAFETLQSLRGDLAAIDADVQFSYKESIEPVYRKLAGLLLQDNASQADLSKARQVIEALQLRELDNFFQDACLEASPVQIDQIDPQAAAIYPIILSDRLEVILSLPDGSLDRYSTPLSAAQVEQTLQKFYSSLYPGYSDRERLQLSREIYDWVVRPAEADLEKFNVKTLAFVLDGFFQSIPMAALHDGQKYLIENYAVTLSPGLQLFPEGLQRRDSQMLAAGLTKARDGFDPLPGVELEIDRISEGFEGKILLNEGFTRNAFQAEIDVKSFPIVHLATHGQFSSDPEKTFLLAWDERINVRDFTEMFQLRQRENDPVELLVLSACQTATGDRRATLGLAGFALRSGARSTVATLWSVNDLSTADLMVEFYDRIARPDVPKAEALRQAQLTLLSDSRYDHPYYWAPFVLVGNWL